MTQKEKRREKQLELALLKNLLTNKIKPLTCLKQRLLASLEVEKLDN